MSEGALERLLALRLHQRDGQRSPHKPLLTLLALGRLAQHGRSAVRWSEAESQLAALIAEFGPPSKTGAAQSAAYPFTRLRSDGVWQLDADVPMDNVGPLRVQDPVGTLVPELEQPLARDRSTLLRTARGLVLSHFPKTLAGDVLLAVGLDPDDVLRADPLVGDEQGRRRDGRWRADVLAAWDRQCAFCGYDGQLGGAPVGLDAAHVRWFAYDGPDQVDNGLALCVLHHKLFDRGAIGVDRAHRLVVSGSYSARTAAGRVLYDLHGHALAPRPGTPLPRADHLAWHAREVFKGDPLAA